MRLCSLQLTSCQHLLLIDFYWSHVDQPRPESHERKKLNDWRMQLDPSVKCVLHRRVTHVTSCGGKIRVASFTPLHDLCFPLRDYEDILSNEKKSKWKERCWELWEAWICEEKTRKHSRTLYRRDKKRSWRRRGVLLISDDRGKKKTNLETRAEAAREFSNVSPGQKCDLRLKEKQDESGDHALHALHVLCVVVN